MHYLCLCSCFALIIPATYAASSWTSLLVQINVTHLHDRNPWELYYFFLFHTQCGENNIYIYFWLAKKMHFDPWKIFSCVQHGDTTAVGSGAKTLPKTCGINPVLVWIYNFFPKRMKLMSDHDCCLSLWFEGNAASREQRWHRNFNLHPSCTNALRNPHAVYTNWSLCFKREHLSGKCCAVCGGPGTLTPQALRFIT